MSTPPIATRTTAGSGPDLRTDTGPSRFVAAAAEHPVDEWGRNEQFVALMDPLFRLRWSVRIDGPDGPDGSDGLDGRDGLAAITSDGGHQQGTLLVVNRRWWALDLVWVAWALGRRLGRPVRFVGHPDRVPSGPLLRRMGALIEHPAEVRGALRHGEVVLLGANAVWHPRDVGAVEVAMIGAAMEANARVMPAAAISSPVTRRALLRIGEAVTPSGKRRGPLAEAEFAEQVQAAVQRLLHRPDGGVIAPRRQVGRDATPSSGRGVA